MGALNPIYALRYNGMYESLHVEGFTTFLRQLIVAQMMLLTVISNRSPCAGRNLHPHVWQIKD
jgi:hypothetical protein